MPVSVVVGGQFGSEGKGKVALELAREMKAAAVIRVGGPNSGHTAYDLSGQRHVFRMLPTAALLPVPLCIVPAGAYVDVEVLLDEIAQIRLAHDRLVVDPNAVIVTPDCKVAERKAGLRERIGSTLSGTGAAVLRRIQRDGSAKLATEDDRLKPFIRSTRPLMRRLLSDGKRLIIEGTQGFGLSLLHSEYYPKVTSRDTTAAAFVSEAGLSPLDVDDIVLVIRAFPIRVPGDSGPLPNETTWQSVTAESGAEVPIEEFTSVTQQRRRVGLFDPAVVRSAIETNCPTRIVLNHLDYIDCVSNISKVPTAKVSNFICSVERSIDRQIDLIGIDDKTVIAVGLQRKLLRA